MRARALAENFEDQAGAVDHLGLPAPFEIALLHWAERRIDDNEADLVFVDDAAQRLDIAAAEKRPGRRSNDTDNLGANHIEIDRLGKPDRFREARLSGAR